jgi:hypothetical protein
VRTLLGWQALLLIPQPPLSLLYLLAVRGELARPSFVPLAVLAALPAAVLVASGRAVCRAAQGARRGHAITLGIAAAELVWSVLAQALMGFAIAWRSG